MTISVDISYYPLKDEFIPPILDFIGRLKQNTNLEVNTNGLSTQVFGEYFEVMNTLTKEMHTSCEIPHSVFVLKIINSDRR